MGDLGRPEEKWQPTGWGAVAQAERGQAGPGQGFFIFCIFSFFTKKYSNFFYKSSSLAGAPWGLVPWSMAPGCQAPPPRALGTLAPRPGEPGPRCK